jgi:hypothetical protein
MSVRIRDPCNFPQRAFATRDWHHLATLDVNLLDTYVALGQSLEEIRAVYHGHFSNSGQTIGLDLIMDPPMAFEQKEESWIHAVVLEFLQSLQIVHVCDLEFERCSESDRETVNESCQKILNQG